VWSARRADGANLKCPWRDIFFWRGVLLALLFLLNEVLPQCRLRKGWRSQAPTNLSSGSTSDGNGERVGFDTNMPTIVSSIAPCRLRSGAAVPAPAAEPQSPLSARGLQAFCAAQAVRTKEAGAETQHNARSQKPALPSNVVVAQHTRFWLFCDDTW